MKKKVNTAASTEKKERKEQIAKWLELFINFLGNVIAIVLGVVITFMIQAKIDRANELKDVRSALELVRTELQANRDDINILNKDFVEKERLGADYYLTYLANPKKNPSDSLEYYEGILLANVSVHLPHDALELLKMSSTFQKIGDNPLAMKIIRAYDSCASTEAYITRHIATRDARYKGKLDAEFLRPLTVPNQEAFTDVSDIDAAIQAIEAYLNKH